MCIISQRRYSRKKLLPLLGVLLLLIGCPKKDTLLDLTITEDPAGGSQVTSVTVEFEAALVDGDTPITITLEWWWENAVHENDTKMDTETFTASSQTTTTFTSTYTADAGYILMNYYWVKIKWTDEAGESHEVESDQAYCYQ
jgi:hypothetical protein